ALALPWNLYFGVGIPGSDMTLFAVLGGVTLLSLISVALPGSRPRLRFWLNAPYLLLVLAFVGFDAFETVRFGGTVTVPGGGGPGAWLGVAGALLSAQPAIADAEDGAFDRWVTSARVIGYASIVGAVLSFGYNLYWRVRYALHGADGSAEFGKQNIA